MNFPLHHIASIQTGLFAKPGKEGEVVYLQSKHFDEDGRLLVTLHPDLPVGDISEKHILRPGDVLFAAKGTKNFAAVYESHNPPAVASTSFFVIRLRDKTILPAYLAWYLNSNKAQQELKAQAIGTGIPSISKQVLEMLELNVPTLEKQEAVLKISTLFEREKRIRIEIELLREHQIQQYIINAIK